LVVARVPDVAAETVQVAGAYGTKITGSLADGSTGLEGARGPDTTAAPAAVSAGGLTSRAGVDLADEKRSGGRQGGLATENGLGIEKGEERDCEKDDIESLSRHCLM
jgi:hypothetical protein